MTESSPEDGYPDRSNFICGVVEGFYGRPWTTEQRKDLFQKLKKWKMDMYVYAPKDDYKHRAYWRELYTVEEAEHLTSLITAAREQGVAFCYALSPGLDITYSSQKEITALKRKLEQVSQFGCTCFALLFDDIEPEMSEADKQIFQSFAHAQVSITNEIHQHLGCPRFLLCPTQYCSTRAVPTVTGSEYLNTLGTKLSQQIDIMWTGPKVISKVLTTECIEEITAVLRRPPVIWDNLHANDYDQKRIFLGPYCGRSPELIPLLRGVLTNPNCEYNANMIAVRTLAHWAGCSSDAPAHSSNCEYNANTIAVRTLERWARSGSDAPAHMDSVSWDIKLERESDQGVCEDDAPLAVNKHVYHPRQALRLAIKEWLPEFSIPKVAQGPVIKPQAPINMPPVPIIPIMPSVNTCMSLVTGTSNTSTTSTAVMSCSGIPTVHTSQLQALADVCSATPQGPCVSAGVSSIETLNPVANPVMNSLVSASKVVLNESIPNPIIPIANSNMSLPSELPISTLPVPLLGLKSLEQDKRDEKMEPIDHNESLSNDSVLESASFIEEMKKVDKRMEDADRISVDDAPNGVMSVEVTPPRTSPGSAADPPSDVNMNDATSENGSMQVEPSNSPLSTDMMVEPSEASDTVEEPLEDSPLEPNQLTEDDLILLCELFYLPFEHGARGLRLMHDFNWLASKAGSTLPRSQRSEMSEWRRRRCRFAWWGARARRLASRLAVTKNRELHAELHPYVWELCAVIALLDAFLKWLELGKFPPNIATNTKGSYTWFSKGWKEAFESGAQEPWVFRGGLTADLRRLLPVESSGETVRVASAPTDLPLTVRPYTLPDEAEVCAICHKTSRDGSDCSELFPSDLQSLPADRLVAPFLTLAPEYCLVIEDDRDCLAPDAESPDDPDRLSVARAAAAKPDIVGYACAALNSKEFFRRQGAAWIPEMVDKYPETLQQRDDLSPAAKDCIRHFHHFAEAKQAPESVTKAHPAILTCCVLKSCRDPHAPARLITCLLAALTANGATGVHVCINTTDQHLHQFYAKLGFAELAREEQLVYLGRTF